MVGVGALLFASGNTAAASVGRFLQGAGGVFALVGAVYIATQNFPASRAATLIGATQMFGMAGGSAGQFVVGPADRRGPAVESSFWVGMGVARSRDQRAALPAAPEAASRRRGETTGCRRRSAALAHRLPQSAVDPVRADRRPAVHPDDDLRHDLGRALPAGGARASTTRPPCCARRRCRSAGSSAVRCSASSRTGIGRRKPVIVGGALVLLACLAWILYGPRGRASRRTSSASSTGIASGAAMLPYTVIKEANPPRAERHRDGRRQLPELHLQRAAGPRVRAGCSGSVVRRSRRDASSSTTRRRSSRSCAGVGLAIVLTLAPEGNRDRRGPRRARGPSIGSTEAMNRRNRNGKVRDSCSSAAAASSRSRPRWRIPARRPRWPARSRPRELGLITPILVGPAAKIEEIARSRPVSISRARGSSMRRTATPPRPRRSSWCAQGEAELLMKGSLHTDELLGAVVARETGLRTGRRISHVFIMDVPTYHKVLIVTDAAINIAPTLEDKVDICQNAIDLARLARRRAAEGRDPRRGRDGQLEDAGHARRRRAVQDGRARPDHGRPARRPAGVRQRDQQGGGADQGHHVGGRRRSGHPARRRTSRRATSWPSSSASWPTPTAPASCSARACPIILTSRADSVRSRIASCAVAMLVAHARRQATARDARR